ncbi:hypothetical protein DERF_015779 [Dermatophagoides farinae]|uniref:Uncharacterized protein n=1 Tax=Dermatophagoides farinae TaxID=6954 RepID=A0A922HF40_DERFA|nr:hypothetical protein DERF_015779 [Dermatophagoides farinae]
MAKETKNNLPVFYKQNEVSLKYLSENLRTNEESMNVLFMESVPDNGKYNDSSQFTIRYILKLIILLTLVTTDFWSVYDDKI